MADEDTQDETEDALEERVTAPMQSFTTSDVTTGFLVLVVGLLITFVLPFVF